MRTRYLLLTLFLILATASFGQDAQKPKSLEVYGFVMADVGYDFNQVHPDWFDALRVTKLPSYENQYAPDGKVFFGVRQTRFGVKGYLPSAAGEIKTVFEFDMFGVGVDAGQTTIRLRHAYAEAGKFLVGQTNSPFQDGDIWPNTVEYWGPTGMVFFRNVQVRYSPLQGKNELQIALERPGASADQGVFAGRIELDSVKGQFNVPDLSMHYRRNGDWGHIQLAGMLRSIKWKDIHTTGGYDIGGSATGWGVHLSTAINLGKKDVFRGSIVYGEGVQNYMNDAPVDIGIVYHTGDIQRPVSGKALPVTGIVAFIDHAWSGKFSTSIGYSSTHIENTQWGSPDAYRNGRYAALNLVYTPFPNAMAAAELLWGRRENFSDGFSSDDLRLQFAFKYAFSQVFYRKDK